MFGPTFKPWMLRLHRWLALAFAVPLLGVVLTGLVLSFEPIAVTQTIKPGSLATERVLDLLRTHGPESGARSLSIRPYDGVMAITDAEGERIDVDLATGALVPETRFQWSDVFGFARGAHETLLFEEGWLVEASTWAMLVLVALGLLLGFTRVRNDASGWHKSMAWIGLPLLILSPLTGLALVYGITFTSPASGPRPQPIPLVEAVRIVGAEKDLATVSWIRNRGGRQLVRVVEDGAYRTYAVTPGGLRATAANWPRLIHEGNWAGAWSGWLNVALSVAILGLMGTGVWIWAKRRFRRRSRVRAPALVTR